MKILSKKYYYRIILIKQSLYRIYLPTNYLILISIYEYNIEIMQKFKRQWLYSFWEQWPQTVQQRPYNYRKYRRQINNT